VSNPVAAIRVQIDRQIYHWASAVARLKLDDLASPEAWGRLEQYLGVALRRHLTKIIDRLQREVDALAALQRTAYSITALADLRRRLLNFRRQYTRTEITLDYFTDAINTRTTPRMAAMMRACDVLAHRSMTQLLDPLGLQTPPVLTYVDLGLGASILKAGLRLWDGGEASPVAAIKVTRHNLLRLTSLIHEAGHQVAHITDWNAELKLLLSEGLRDRSPELADAWAGWASEIAADAFAFAHTGYASVAALHDVVAGEDSQVFRHNEGDPHPISFLRVLLGIEACRHFYGSGPWDDLARSWTTLHPIDRLSDERRQLINDSVAALNAVVKITYETNAKAFGGRSLRSWLAPERVSPKALEELSDRVGPALFTSAHWLWNEPLRILALTGFRISTGDRQNVARDFELQEQSMLRLGGALQAA
jgi:hypothetical protein